MRKLLLLGLYWLVTVSALAFNTPGKINYQGVARSADGALLVNQQLGIQIQIRTVDSNGDVVYSEVHTVITNQYGLFNLQIGDGSIESGVFTDVDWAANTFVELSIDFEGGTDYVSMGTSQLVSVPYALHSKTADNVFSGNFNDLINAPANVSDFANDAGYITSADNTDSDATNEIQDLSLIGSTLKITNNATATEINLAPFSGTNTDEQTLILVGTDLSITNGNLVDLSPLQDGVNDADADATNEIQQISLIGSTLEISDDASTVDLSGFYDNTDAQTLSLVGTEVSISGGNTIDVVGIQDGFEANTDTQLTEAEVDGFVANNGYLSTEIDGSITNELQTISLSGTDLSISSKNTIDLSSLKSQTLPTTTISTNTTIDNTSQYIYINGVRELTLPANPTSGMMLYINAGSGGATINANGKLFREDGVSVATPVSFTDLVGGKGTVIISYYGTWDIFSKSSQPDENQSLSLSGNDLSISGGNTITLPARGGGTDDQTIDELSLMGTHLQLSLEGDGEATKVLDLSGLADGYEPNTDSQIADVFSLTGSTLNLSLSGDGQATKTVDLSSLQDGTGTDSQTLSISGNDITILGGNTITIPSGGAGTDDQKMDIAFLDGTDLKLSLESDGEATKIIDLSPLQDGNTQLNEAQVDAFVADNGFLIAEIDGSLTNELQTLSLSGTDLTISSENTVDLSSLQDGTGTDMQGADLFSFDGSTLSLSLDNDGEAANTVDLSSLSGGGGTDDQKMDIATLNGTNLELSLESDGEATKIIDLSSLQDGVGTFSNVGIVTSNSNGNTQTDDFVFGSPSLDYSGNTNHRSRFFFDKSKGAFIGQG